MESNIECHVKPGCFVSILNLLRGSPAHRSTISCFRSCCPMFLTMRAGPLWTPKSAPRIASAKKVKSCSMTYQEVLWSRAQYFAKLLGKFTAMLLRKCDRCFLKKTSAKRRNTGSRCQEFGDTPADATRLFWAQHPTDKTLWGRIWLRYLVLTFRFFGCSPHHHNNGRNPIRLISLLNNNALWTSPVDGPGANIRESATGPSEAFTSSRSSITLRRVMKSLGRLFSLIGSAEHNLPHAYAFRESDSFTFGLVDTPIERAPLGRSLLHLSMTSQLAQVKSCWLMLVKTFGMFALGIRSRHTDCCWNFVSGILSRCPKMPRAFLVKQKAEKFKRGPSNFIVSSPGNGKRFCSIVFVHLLFK